MQKSLNNLLIIKGFICDPGAIQTHDLQNRNLTLTTLLSTIYQCLTKLLTLLL